MLEADAAFHSVLVRAAGNPALDELDRGLNVHVTMARAYYVQDWTRIQTAHAEHSQIIAACLAGQPTGPARPWRRTCGRP